MKWLVLCAVVLAPLSGAAFAGERYQVDTKWPFDSSEAKRRQQETAKALGVPVEQDVDLSKGVKLRMVLIPAGEFMMGGHRKNEVPKHRVVITKPFWLGKYEVTQEQWQAVMSANPSYFKVDKNPVETVSWNDIQGFLGKVNGRARGGRFALPTEAQWEYACRAGNEKRFCFGDGKSLLAKHAWYDSNSGRTTHRVGKLEPNSWGLHDMHGNVLEWCSDWYADDYYASSPREDPPGPGTGMCRVLRGGSWLSSATDCESGFRNSSPPSHLGSSGGFRVSRTLDAFVAVTAESAGDGDQDAQGEITRSEATLSRTKLRNPRSIDVPMRKFKAVVNGKVSDGYLWLGCTITWEGKEFDLGAKRVKSGRAGKEKGFTTTFRRPLPGVETVDGRTREIPADRAARYSVSLWRRKISRSKCKDGPCEYCKKNGYHLEDRVDSSSGIASLPMKNY